MANSRRKRVRHYDLPGHCHELTFSCFQRQPLLAILTAFEELSIAIDRANARHGWRLAAFVFMPEHVHLLVHPAERSSRIAELLFAIKRPSSYRIKEHLSLHSPSQLAELTIRQRPGASTFRFWQEGPGYDRNITSEKALLESIDYLHRNPVRRRLCQTAVDWAWSSARWYQSDGLLIDERWPALTPLPAGHFHIRSTGNVGM